MGVLKASSKTITHEMWLGVLCCHKGTVRQNGPGSCAALMSRGLLVVVTHMVYSRAAQE